MPGRGEDCGGDGDGVGVPGPAPLKRPGRGGEDQGAPLQVVPGTPEISKYQTFFPNLNL